ncbi:MAG: exopolyphosphatase, partial [Gammaproteobacteria bacterium]|nr:exopolyphosphatase [Gammaproteobacteria bacterium]
MKIIKQHFTSLPETIAAIDLGSNSFHMLIAKHEGGNLVTVDQLKESVRLRAGLDADNNLSAEATERALECLARFGQRIQHFPAKGVRIIGTNTLRRAANSQELLEKAESLLGHRIEIVSGIEEARLIYLGVAHHVEEDNGRRMVIDIGGGSTEITLGERFDPFYIKSFEMGSVYFTQRFFNEGKISKKRLRQATLAAELQLEPYVEHYKRLNWSNVIGASGTIKAVANVVFKMGWCKTGITAEAMELLLNEISQYTSIDDAKLTGLKADRKPVFVGGFIVLKAIFDTFKIEKMRVSEGALREGILYDLIGREEHEDTRSRTIQSRAQRYNVDSVHADAVKNTALDLFSQIALDWHIDDDECQRQLEWAADIHEIGLSIAHSQSH